VKKTLLALAALLLPLAAISQSLTVNPLSGRSPLTTTVTWDVPNATNCTATGTGWTGTKAASGSQQVVLSVDSTVGLSCSVSTPAGPGTAVLTWTAPTQNTDGSAYTNPGGYWVYRGSSVATLAQFRQITNPATLSFTDTTLPAGQTTHYALTAYNAVGAESALSASGNKTISGAPVVSTFVDSKSVTVTPPPKPVSPVLTVQ